MQGVTIYVSLDNKFGHLTIDGDFALFMAFVRSYCERGLIGALKEAPPIEQIGSEIVHDEISS